MGKKEVGSIDVYCMRWTKNKNKKSKKYFYIISIRTKSFTAQSFIRGRRSKITDVLYMHGFLEVTRYISRGVSTWYLTWVGRFGPVNSVEVGKQNKNRLPFITNFVLEGPSGY